MRANTKYEIIKKIKIHTKPTIFIDVRMEGIFVKETNNYYVFDSFKVRKENVVNIKLIG